MPAPAGAAAPTPPPWLWLILAKSRRSTRSLSSHDRSLMSTCAARPGPGEAGRAG